MEYIIKEKDLNKFCIELLNIFKKTYNNKALFIALKGDIGYGKTTLTKNFSKIIGIKEEVVSPTFMISKLYKTKDNVFKKLVHIDCYRFLDKDDWQKRNLDSMIDDESLIFIEWPEHTELLFDIHIEIKIIDSETRKFFVN